MQLESEEIQHRWQAGGCTCGQRAMITLIHPGVTLCTLPNGRQRVFVQITRLTFAQTYRDLLICPKLEHMTFHIPQNPNIMIPSSQGVRVSNIPILHVLRVYRTNGIFLPTCFCWLLVPYLLRASRVLL